MIRIESLSKEYGDIKAVKNISLVIAMRLQVLN